MKKYFYAIAICAFSSILASCHKENMPAPESVKVKSTYNGVVSGHTDYLDPLSNPPYTPPTSCPASKH